MNINYKGIELIVECPDGDYLDAWKCQYFLLVDGSKINIDLFELIGYDEMKEIEILLEKYETR